MPITITMPALSPTMEEGALAKWLVKEGDAVSAGDVIAEIETDKATMEVEAVDEGTMGKILVAEGTEGVKVNETIALLLEEGEDESALEDAASAAAQDTKADSKQASEPKDAPETSDKKPAPEQSAKPPAQKGASRDNQGKNGRIFASPLARRLAEENSLDLNALSGSGPHGRIIRRDIEQALKGGTARAQPDKPGAAAPADTISPSEVYAFYADDSFEAEPVDSMRRTIAGRLTQSKRDIPHYYLTIDCELDALLAARKKLNVSLEDDARISVNDFIIKAAAMALMKVPGVNASWAGTEVLRHKHADVSMAVAIEGGLITPIIRAAETKGLAEIAGEAKDLAARARDRKLKPEEYQGGTFSISNLGMFGIKHFTAVINPPQSAILAIGGGEKRAVARADGTLEAATVMSVTMSCDHRVVDGALGARYLQAFRAFIEEPVRMLM